MCLGKPGAGSLARLESALIFEQAFMAMPEFLTGTPFSEYQFEATIAPLGRWRIFPWISTLVWAYL